MAFHRPKSLQDYLVRAKLRPLDQNPGGNRGTHKCTSNRCDVCNYLAVGDSFSSHVTGTSYTVNHRLDCNSRNVVYLISCKKSWPGHLAHDTLYLKSMSAHMTIIIIIIIISDAMSSQQLIIPVVVQVGLTYCHSIQLLSIHTIQWVWTKNSIYRTKTKKYQGIFKPCKVNKICVQVIKDPYLSSLIDTTMVK